MSWKYQCLILQTTSPRCIINLDLGKPDDLNYLAYQYKENKISWEGVRVSDLRSILQGLRKSNLISFNILLKSGCGFVCIECIAMMSYFTLSIGQRDKLSSSTHLTGFHFHTRKIAWDEFVQKTLIKPEILDKG